MRIIAKRNSRRLYLLLFPITRTTDIGRAEKSRFTWSVEPEAGWNGSLKTQYLVATLTPLGILNGLFGLKVRVVE